METVELVGRKIELDADGHLKSQNDWDKVKMLANAFILLILTASAYVVFKK